MERACPSGCPMKDGDMGMESDRDGCISGRGGRTERA